MTVTVALHPVSAGEGLGPAAPPLDVALEPAWTVRDLAAAAERRWAEQGLGVRVCALISPSRGRAAPPQDSAAVHFSPGDRALVVGDVRRPPWPGPLAVVDTKPPRQAGSPVPITIFTGFLGAGKTTVLNHLLLGQRGKKFAVIENEFGEVPIDNELLPRSALGLAEQVVVMENGCMCCTVRGDLLGAFDAIRRQMAQGSPLDAVLVETTGMADPVPIVRTLRQTPDIAKHFRLDGTITLVDTKTILDRLEECEGGREDQERHRQIAFADKILLSKLDLATPEQLAAVWQRIRSFNAGAPIVSSVRGVVPPSELTNLGAFDMQRIAVEHEELGHGGHGHGRQDNGRGHGHEECGEDCQDDHGDSHGHAWGHGHGHEASRHDSEVESFSIVWRGQEVEQLDFARWVRVIATLPEEQGKLYRSKGILAAAGRPAKLIFHAVADVAETSDGPEWGENEPRICKIVFIGKKLARKEIEARFTQLLRPMAPGPRFRPRPAEPGPAARASGTAGASFTALAQGGLLHHALLGCWVKDVFRVGQACAALRDATCSPHALAAFQAAATGIPLGAPRGLQAVEGPLWLHALLPMGSIKRYAQAWRGARVKLVTKCSGEYTWGEPLQFHSLADVEAAGVMWLELMELNDVDTTNFLVEFGWRPETMESFFAVPGSATNSALVKVTVEDPSGDSDSDDDLKFRVNLNPETMEESGMTAHRLSLQLVGGKTSSHVYQIFFHTVDPAYQVHINVPDHRTPIFQTKEVFHQWHPLMDGLKKRPRLRFLLRCKSMESGPLDAMCGCCG